MSQPSTIELLMQHINEHIQIKNDAAAATVIANLIVEDKQVVGKVHTVEQEGGHANHHGRDLGSSVLEDISKKVKKKGHKTRRI